jgi:MFS family permease
MRAHWIHVGRGAAALAAAMGVGRFVYTPILPLMTAHAGLSAAGAGHLATANYAGYLAGALAGTVFPRLARSAVALRASLVVTVAGLAAMALTHNEFGWIALRALAGAASALVFVIAVNSMLDHLRDHAPHLPGWGFGGVGLGIALSGLLVLATPDGGGWQATWWVAAAVAAVLAVVAWPMAGGPGTPAAEGPRAGRSRLFGALATSYTLEGVGYIIAGTFLVAAIAQQSPGWLGSTAWVFVGVAALPSAALWARLSDRWSHPSLLTAALLLQAAGIALPAVAGGVAAALAGAVLFGSTFVGVTTISLAAGRVLSFPRAVAVLTAGYSVGQIAGPLLVTPLLHRGFAAALVVAAAIVLAAAVAAAVLRRGYPARAVRVVGGQPAVGAHHLRAESVDHGAHR